MNRKRFPIQCDVPASFWLASIAADLAALAIGDRLFWRLSTWLIIFGVVSAARRALVGTLDSLELHRLNPAKMVAYYNIGVIALAESAFAGSLALRGWSGPPDSAIPTALAFSICGVVSLSLGLWYGTELLEARAPRRFTHRKAIAAVGTSDRAYGPSATALVEARWKAAKPR